MRQKAQVAFTLLTAIVDAAMAVLAVYLAYKIRERIPFPAALRLGPFSEYVPLAILHAASLLVTFFIFRLYHLRRGRSRIDVFYSILSSVSFATIASTALGYLLYSGGSELTRGMIIYTWIITIVLTNLGRVLTSWLYRYIRRLNPEQMLLVGSGDVARMILQKTVQSTHLGYRVIGFIDGNGEKSDIAGVPMLGTFADLAHVVREHQVREVVVALPEASHEELLDIISVCELERANVRVFPDLFQIIASELSIDDLDGLPLLTVRDVALRGWKLTVKRSMDLIGSALSLVVLSPFMLLVALLIKLESKGPVFYTQIRVGLDGKPFPMLKFRSMRVDAEEESGPVWAQEGDPRRTMMGSLLRKTSIDELPQLINVLLGDMSLVGPRPERPVFVEQFKQVVPRYMERHKEKAGITGWAQVNGLRGNTSIVERTKYDLYYIENWSILFDLKIILRTLLNQFRGDRNAY